MSQITLEDETATSVDWSIHTRRIFSTLSEHPGEIFEEIKHDFFIVRQDEVWNDKKNKLVKVFQPKAMGMRHIRNFKYEKSLTYADVAFCLSCL